MLLHFAYLYLPNLRLLYQSLHLAFRTGSVGGCLLLFTQFFSDAIIGEVDDYAKQREDIW